MPETDAARLLVHAYDQGVNYVDTARSYTNGEASIGCVPKEIRDQLIVATKTGARGGARCVQDLKESLAALKRPWLDVWMTHMMSSEAEYEQCIALGGFCDVAAAAKRAGFVRASGASFHASTELIDRAISDRAFDVVMFQMNLINRETVFGSSIKSYRDTLLPHARTHGVGVVVMKVLAGGELRHGAPRLRTIDPDSKDVRGVRTSVRYATMNPAVATAVVGMRDVGELLECCAAVESVTNAQLEQFDHWSQLAQDLSKSECTRCGACLGACPEGLELPKIFRLYDQATSYGMDRFAQHKYSLLPVDAASCIECGDCQRVCPETFDIVAALRQAHRELAPGATLLSHVKPAKTA